MTSYLVVLLISKWVYRELLERVLLSSGRWLGPRLPLSWLTAGVYSISPSSKPQQYNKYPHAITINQWEYTLSNQAKQETGSDEHF
jgi:hypothetical protein